MSIGLRWGLAAWAVSFLFAFVAHAQAQLRGFPGEAASNPNLDVACTEAGLKARRQLQLKTYPITLEFVGGYGQGLTNTTVIISHGDGRGPVTAVCSSPRVLMLLPAGNYMAAATVTDDRTKTFDFPVSNSSRRNIITRFPSEMAGAPDGHSG